MFARRRPIVKQVDTLTRHCTTEDDITAEVLRRLDKTKDARLRRIMLSLIQHLHHFVKDVELTEAEWAAGIRFLTDTGQMCSATRQEFTLLSDTLGVSTVVDLINHRKPDRATESTVFGPSHRDEMKGMPAIVSGRVVDVTGRPVAGALVDVWHADSCRTDQEGRYLVRAPRPVAYQIPTDGPVGKLLRATDRHAWRPAHLHFVVSADRFDPVTTHIYDSIDKYLESDAVFAVKQSLICTFTEHHTRDEAAQQFKIEPPFCTAEFDFVLKPARP